MAGGRNYKSQSAMEYLMTYGWAILIIAVVLAVLFQLGVFSGGNFLPHAQAGSCQVSRTIAGISLEGQCNGMLPEYVAQFNGGNSYIQPSSGVLGGSSSLTVNLWFNTKTVAASGQYGWIDEEGVWGFKYGQPADTQFCFATVAGSWTWCVGAPSTYTFNANTWYFIAFTYNNGSPTEFYIDGIQYPGSVETGVMTTGTDLPLQIGQAVSSSSPYTTLDGSIANIQIYNASLSSAEISALYLEGIGGAPIRPQNLTAWWPLNGNANDYSGNNNNGQLSNVIFSSSWESGYTAP